jgi:hypothetical protein
MPPGKSYLTDFPESVFIGEIAKNFDFCGGEIRKTTRIYHANFNHAAALRKCAPAVIKETPKALSGIAKNSGRRSL